MTRRRTRFFKQNNKDLSISKPPLAQPLAVMGVGCHVRQYLEEALQHRERITEGLTLNIEIEAEEGGQGGVAVLFQARVAQESRGGNYPPAPRDPGPARRAPALP
jgi:hypothetical protein